MALIYAWCLQQNYDQRAHCYQWYVKTFCCICWQVQPASKINTCCCVRCFILFKKIRIYEFGPGYSCEKSMTPIAVDVPAYPVRKIQHRQICIYYLSLVSLFTYSKNQCQNYRRIFILKMSSVKVYVQCFNGLEREESSKTKLAHHCWWKTNCLNTIINNFYWEVL